MTTLNQLNSVSRQLTGYATYTGTIAICHLEDSITINILASGNVSVVIRQYATNQNIPALYNSDQAYSVSPNVRQTIQVPITSPWFNVIVNNLESTSININVNTYLSLSSNAVIVQQLESLNETASSTSNVVITGSLPSGTNTIGSVGITGSLPSGTNTIGSVGITGSVPSGTNTIGSVQCLGQNSNFNFFPTVDNNTIQIYADGVKGTNVTGGWQFTNTAVNKINWYLYQAPVTSTGAPTTAGQTVSSINSVYCVINQQSTLGLAQAQNPFVIIYTIPDSGTNASFYKSKLFYGSNAFTDILGLKLLYTGTDPVDIHPEITGINRIKLDFNLSLSTKTEAQASSELVGSCTLQTTANTPVGQFNFTMAQFGVDWEKVNVLLPIENGKVVVDTGVVITTESSPTGAKTNLLGNTGDLVIGVHSTLQSLNLSKIGGGGFAYVKIYNKATAPTATDTPVFTIPIQNNSIQQVECHSLDFPLGIGLRATLNFDPTDTNEPTGTIYGTAFYTNVI